MNEVFLSIHVEALPEGVFLATSEELPGLVAQGRTVAETLEIAHPDKSGASSSSLTESTETNCRLPFRP